MEKTDVSPCRRRGECQRERESEEEERKVYVEDRGLTEGRIGGDALADLGFELEVLLRQPRSNGGVQHILRRPLSSTGRPRVN